MLSSVLAVFSHSKVPGPGPRTLFRKRVVRIAGQACKLREACAAPYAPGSLRSSIRVASLRTLQAERKEGVGKDVEAEMGARGGLHTSWVVLGVNPLLLFFC